MTQIKVITDFAQLQLLREGDKVIMDGFATNFQGEHLCKLDYMRMSLHAVSLADIIKFDSQKIKNAAWNLKRSNMLHNNMQWPWSPTEFPAS